MKIKILEGKELPTIEQILELELEIGYPLPEDYKNFLLAYNGGFPQPDRFGYTLHGVNLGSIVNRFLSLHSGKLSNLRTYIQTYKNRIPSGFIPIAYDPCGNLICFSLIGLTHGHVYFWDHELEAEEGDEPTLDNLAILASSFTEFLNALV